MVLDPGSALSIAGNVLQFVDLATKVVSKSKQYYNSLDGALVEHRELSTVADKLCKLSRTLQNSLQQKTSTISDGSIDAESKHTPAEQGLWDANNECYKISVDLVEALQALKITDKHRKWQSLWHALRSTWSAEKIEMLSSRLTQAREHLMTHLLVHISLIQGFDHVSIINKADEVQRNILEAVQHSSHNLQDQIKSLSRSLENAEATEHAHILEYWQVVHRVDLKELSRGLYEATEGVRVRNAQEQLLDSLYFTRLEDRRDRIAEAHKQTFEWIFGGTRGDGTRWDDFDLWLRGHSSHKGLFWICGKAGSGKSTLMRYLDNNEKTKSHLQKWADNKRLATASCFFWKAGTTIQKSLTGMLRSLLHQLLVQSKAFIADTNPWRWRRLHWGLSRLDDWTDIELVKTIQKLVQLAQPTMRFAIFIDGLDEFEGDDAEMQDLIDFFQGLADDSNVKVCVSSRPWNIFEDAFADCAKLRLHELTLEDIKIYVQDTLDKSRRFRQLCQIDQPQCLDLVTDIVEKATGVFLWVFLVVRELVKGLRNGYDLRRLRKRLQELPSDLNAFFRQMINSIELSDRPAASKVFQIVLTESKVTTLMTLAFIEVENVDFALERVMIMPTLASINAANEAALRRINSLCMGLLEAKRPREILTRCDVAIIRDHELASTWNWEIDYLHRTVKDFLLQEEARELLLSYTNGEYNTKRYLCNAMLSQMMLVSALPVASHQQKRQPAADARSCLFFDFVESLMHVVEATEAANHSLPTALLLRVEQVFDDYIPTIHAAGLRSADRRRSRAWECTERRLEWDCSFLTLTLQYNVKGLYSVPLESNTHTSHADRGRPKLDFALRRWMSNKNKCLPPNPHLIEILLNDGADPTEAFEHDSVWGHFLTYMASLHDRGRLTHISQQDTDSHANTETDISNWHRSTELLISYGALEKETQGGKEDMRTTISRIFGVDAAQKLLCTPVCTPVRRSPRTLEPVQRLDQRQTLSLRSRLVFWISREQKEASRGRSDQ